MALTKSSKKYEKLVNRIKLVNEMHEINVKLETTKINKKSAKLKQNQEYEEYLAQISYANIDDEINRRLPRYLNKENKIEYWQTRKLIQNARLKNFSVEAMEEFNLEYQKVLQRKQIATANAKEKIRASLIPYMVTEYSEEELRQNHLNLVELNKVAYEEYSKILNSELSVKIEKLEAKKAAKLEKLNAKLDEVQKVLELENENSKINQLSEDILLRVENLTMQFGGLRAVDNLSFDVKKGEVFGLIGPNGAGKTTVFNCITQFYKPTAGQVYLRQKSGETILMNDIKVHDVIKKGIVRTFQNVEVVKEVTVLENLLIAAHTQYRSNLLVQFLHLPLLKKEELAIKEKALEVLEFLDLTIYKDMLAWGLPYGILKKIEIARTLMNDPALIILDEPAAGLNDTETQELTKLIKKIQQKYDCTILLVEHDMGLVMDICDTICAISFGKMLAIGNTTEIQSNKAVQEAYLGVSED